MHEIMDGWKTVGVRSLTAGTIPNVVIVPTPEQRVVITAFYTGGNPAVSSQFSLTGSVSGVIAPLSNLAPSSQTTESNRFRFGHNVTSAASQGVGEHSYIPFEKGETVTFGDLNNSTMHVDYQLQEEI